VGARNSGGGSVRESDTRKVSVGGGKKLKGKGAHLCFQASKTGCLSLFQEGNGVGTAEGGTVVKSLNSGGVMKEKGLEKN